PRPRHRKARRDQGERGCEKSLSRRRSCFLRSSEKKLLLEIRDLQTAYASSQVLFGISLDIRERETVALLGRNGMGKTTAVRSIMGLTRARGGAISFRGARIEREA